MGRHSLDKLSDKINMPTDGVPMRLGRYGYSVEEYLELKARLSGQRLAFNGGIPSVLLTAYERAERMIKQEEDINKYAVHTAQTAADWAGLCAGLALDDAPEPR